MTALIVDDEFLARSLLRGMLESEGVTVLGEAEDAKSALEMAEELAPEVVFMDVRMPGLSGVEASSSFQELESAPFVILVTGFSDYAVEAFNRSLTDYLLKPVSPERLTLALGKIRRQLALRRKARRAEYHLQLNQGASLQRLPVRVKGSYRVLPVDSIVCAMTSEKIVLIKTKTGDYRSTYTLSYLEEILPHKFMRVHASCIVNLATVEEILLLGNHSYALKLVNGVELPVGRLQYAKLQQRLGFPSVV